MSLAGTSKIERIIETAPSRDDAVEATYLVTRLISHREVLARGVSRKAFLARYPESSPKSRRLALIILDEITKEESVPLQRISQRKLDTYGLAASRAMRRRLREEMQLDDGRGLELLEELRRAG